MILDVIALLMASAALFVAIYAANQDPYPPVYHYDKPKIQFATGRYIYHNGYTPSRPEFATVTHEAILRALLDHTGLKLVATPPEPAKDMEIKFVKKES